MLNLQLLKVDFMKYWNYIKLLFLILPFGVEAQLNLPLRKIGNVDFYYRKVNKKETIYGISKELGISKEDIIKYNPSAESGLKKDQILYFPVSDFKNDSRAKLQNDNDKEVHKHLVKSGETIYGISKTYGIEMDDLINANPVLKNGLKSGMKIIIPAKQSAQKYIPYTIKKGETLYRVSVDNNISIESLLKTNPGISLSNFRVGDTIMLPLSDDVEAAENAHPQTVFIGDKIKKGDTFESIAQKHNVAVAVLMEANPNIDKLKVGSYIYIPVATEADTITDDTIRQTYNRVHRIETSDEVNITLIMPFESESKTPSQKAVLYKNFYGGFLMGLQQFEDKNAKINLNVFDSNETPLHSILSQDRTKESDMVFIAGETEDIKEVGDFGKENGINVVNAFNVNGELCYENERIFQMNTPSPNMYSTVQNTVNEKFSNYRMLFIEDGQQSETKPIIDYLKSTNLPRQTIDFDDLKDAELFKIIVENDKKILLIPTQSNDAMLNTLREALPKLVAETKEYSFSMLGYPEWLAKKNYDHFFHSINTYFYSRYTVGAMTENVAKLNNEYRRWTGQPVVNSVPNMCVYGYDLATFFVDEISKNNNDFNIEPRTFEGMESCINLKRVCNWGGFINTAVFFINYKPNNEIEKTVIK